MIPAGAPNARPEQASLRFHARPRRDWPGFGGRCQGFGPLGSRSRHLRPLDRSWTRTRRTCRSCTPARGGRTFPLRERKLKPNRGSQQALSRRRSKLRLKSVGAARAQASLKRKRSGSVEDRLATEPPRGSRDPPQLDRAHSEISLDACAGSPPASATESVFQCSGPSSEEYSRSCSAHRNER